MLKQFWHINKYHGIYLLLYTFLRLLRHGTNSMDENNNNNSKQNKQQLIVLISAVYSFKSRLYADNKIVLLIIAPEGQHIKHTQMVAKSVNGHRHLNKKFTFRQASPTLPMCHWLAYIAVIDSVVKPTALQIGTNGYNLVNVEVQRPYLKKRVHVGVCFSPLFYMEHWQLVVLAIEIYRHFGISLQIVYLMSAIEGIFELLKEYNAMDVIQLEPWYTFNLAGQQYNNNGSSSVNNPNLEMEWRSQTTAHTDCLLKYGYAAEFLIVGDFDDILVPDHGGKYYDEFLRLNDPNAVAFVYNRLHTAITTTTNPANFSLLNTLMSANVSPKIPLLQKSVVNTSLTESLWVHLPYIIKPFAVFREVPTNSGRMFHIREWHFVADDQFWHSSSIKPDTVPLNAYINKTTAQQISQTFEKTILTQKINNFKKLPSKMHYAQQFVNCYRKVEQAQDTNSLKECPGPHRCSIESVNGTKCVISKRTFSGNKLAPGMILYTAPFKENFQISENGCSF